MKSGDVLVRPLGSSPYSVRGYSIKARREFIYFVLCHSAPKALKIGKSCRPTIRLSYLQTCCPFRLELLYTADLSDYPYGLEAKLHRAFARFRMRGEWFLYNNHTARLVEQFKSGELDLPEIYKSKDTTVLSICPFDSCNNDRMTILNSVVYKERIHAGKYLRYREFTLRCESCGRKHEYRKYYDTT